MAVKIPIPTISISSISPLPAKVFVCLFVLEIISNKEYGCNMNMREYPTLYSDTNKSKGTVL